MSVKKLLTKYREIISYLIFGVLTTVVGVGSYMLFLWLFKVEDNNLLMVQVCNVLSWILAVLFAYFTNKIFVFQKKTVGFKATLIEFGSFVASRLVSLGAESLSLYVLVSLMSVKPDISKYIASVIVIILNYVLGKLIVFRKKSNQESDEE